MDYTTKSELIKALNSKFAENDIKINDENNTRYDANTGTIYSNTGKYTIRDLEEARQKVADFAKKCTSINSTLTLDPSYIKYANIIDAAIVLCEKGIKGKAP